MSGRYTYEKNRNRKKSIMRGATVFAIAFLLGCATMQVMAWSGVSEESPISIAEENVISDEKTVSSTDLEVLNADVALEPVTEIFPDTNLVMIDPGHGGEDEGCSRSGVVEKDINLQIALALGNKLEGMGYEVVYTREDDTYLSLEERVTKANASKADIFVSIHQNAYEEEAVAGLETWYCGAKEDRGTVRSSVLGEDSKRLAQLLHNGLILYSGGQDRGVREGKELKVIRETNMPACLVETGFLSNRKEREKLLDAAYQERIVEGLASGIDLYFYPKTMYLTFDDGPSEENTCKVLDILKERNIKATFFVVGENVRKYPQVAKRIVEEGHTIGIHCNYHKYDVLYESVENYLNDFEEARKTVYEVTGVDTKLFRFPGGSINAYNKETNQDIIAEMTARGYIYFDWNASLEDASKKNEPDRLIQNAKESTLGRRKVIMLAHDIVYNTTVCLDELIEQFPEYQMEPLTEEVVPIQF